MELSTLPTSLGPHTNPTKTEAGEGLLTSVLAHPICGLSAAARGESAACAQMLSGTFQKEALNLLMGGCTSGVWTRGIAGLSCC